MTPGLGNRCSILLSYGRIGVWGDPKTALENYNRAAADLHAGRKPQVSRSDDTPSVKELANRYLACQKEKAD